MGIVRPDQSSSGGGGGGSVTVTDGTHAVANVTTLDFTAGVTVSDAGGGQANASVTAGAPTFTPTATKTANYTAAAGEYVVGDSTAGAFTVTLPAAPANGTLVAVQQIGSANAITVAAGVGDTINATTNSSLGTTRRSALYEYRSSDKVWFAIAPATNPVLSAGAFDGSIVTHGTTTAPTFSTGTLDAVATAQPPSAAVPLNAQKITGLAVATAATDAASLANSLDQFAAPAANVAWNAKKITGLAAASANGDAGRWEQLPAGIMTAGGDLIYASAANTVARLAKGADGTVLTLAAGLPSWAASAAAGSARRDIGLAGRGLLDELYPLTSVANNNVYVSQSGYFMAGMGLKLGDVCTGVVLNCLTAASGSNPTGAFVAIYDAVTGTQLAVSNNLNASAAFTATGLIALPFSGTYTAVANTAIVVGFLINGAWGTTSAKFGAALGGAVITAAAFGANRPVIGINAGITALPSPLGSPGSGGTAQPWWCGLY